MKYRKYIVVKICPIVMKGASTGRAPIHVKSTVDVIRVQNMHLFRGYIEVDRSFIMCVMGMDIRIRIDITRAITPPILFGMDRRMAYANKKYHSGLM